jgi:hypothetical protein
MYLERFCHKMRSHRDEHHTGFESSQPNKTPIAWGLVLFFLLLDGTLSSSPTHGTGVVTMDSSAALLKLKDTSRVRLSIGTARSLDTFNPLLHCSWRLSPPSPSFLGRRYSAGLSSELGVINFFPLLPLLFPYVAIGPELRYYDAFIAGRIGFMLVTLIGWGVLPAATLSGGYVLRIAPSFNLEAEGGVHFFLHYPQPTPYLLIGISF